MKGILRWMCMHVPVPSPVPPTDITSYMYNYVPVDAGVHMDTQMNCVVCMCNCVYCMLACIHLNYIQCDVYVLYEVMW